MINRPKRFPKSNYDRHGLTAIELIVASALAVLLMVSVLGLLARLAAQRQLIDDKTAVEEWQFQLARLIRQDLESAERVRVRPDELSILGYGGWDFTSGAPTLRPTQIRYAITSARGVPWLVREETHLDEATNRNWRRELACRGAMRFEVSAYSTRLRRWDNVLNGRSEQMAAWFTTPGSLRVRIYGDGEDTLLVNEIVSRHGVTVE